MCGMESWPPISAPHASRIKKKAILAQLHTLRGYVGCLLGGGQFFAEALCVDLWDPSLAQNDPPRNGEKTVVRKIIKVLTGGWLFIPARLIGGIWQVFGQKRPGEGGREGKKRPKMAIFGPKLGHFGRKQNWRENEQGTSARRV